MDRVVWKGTHLPALSTIRPPPLGLPGGLGGLRLGGLGGLVRGGRHLALRGAVQGLDAADVVLVQLQVRPEGVMAGWLRTWPSNLSTKECTSSKSKVG